MTAFAHRDKRFKIICSHPTPDNYPFGLGMLLAYAMEHLSDQVFDLGPYFVTTDEELQAHLDAGSQNVLLCSNYVWCTDFNLEFSRRAKELDPNIITMHGGQNTPAYPEAAETFLRNHPEVDFAVCGEGEITLVELLTALAEGRETFEVPGVSYLAGDTMVRNPGRPPSTDINAFPSPYLTGLFDNLDPSVCLFATVESNRGCPYGCAYCSWNDPNDSGGHRKLRLYDLDRVRQEIEWTANRGVDKLFVADSNFGILERDSEVAQAIADTKQKYGRPSTVIINYAKNTHQHVLKILNILDSVKMNSNGGAIGIQTRDPDTLKVIKRHNISSEDFDHLKEALISQGHPLEIHLMLGLPGATTNAFVNDLQYYFDEPIDVTMFHTVLLPNSPMAHPDFMKEHGIVADEHANVSATKAMPHTDMERMKQLGCLFDAAHNLGILRWPLLWLQWEHGLNSVRLLLEILDDPAIAKKFPRLGDAVFNTSSRLVHDHFRTKKERERFDWKTFHEEFANWVEEHHGIKVDDVFACLLDAQTAIMPHQNTEYPLVADLAYDVVSWYKDHKTGSQKPLDQYDPGTLVVREPCFFWKRFLRKNIYIED
jgi:radical SAM superfamily enzyme YgiQ (UPF0313 family)